jgi:hypothetical protein
MPMVTPPDRTPYLPQAVAGRMPVAPDTTGSIRASGRMSYSAE